MVSSKMIFLLHCIGLEQLFSNAIVGAYDFSTCNYSAIKNEYRFLLKDEMRNYTSKDIIDCCAHQPAKKFLSEALGCIHNFTQKYIAWQQENIWNTTVFILKGNCQGYSQMNGMQNVTVTFRVSDKCNTQQQNRAQDNHALIELNEMWRRFLSKVLRRS